MIEEQNINQLPKDWKCVKLGDVAKIKGGKRLPKGEQYAEEKTNYPYLRVVDFDNMTINQKNLKFLNEQTQKQIKNYTISSEDLYISIAGTIGRVGMIPQSLSGSNLTENAAKITEIKDFDLKYLTYVLNSYKIQEQIAEKTIATTQPKLALYRIEKLSLALPPKSTQQAIVSKIEELFSELDKGIEQLKIAQQQLKTYRQSVLKSAFEGNFTNENLNEGELPEGWKQIKLGDVAKKKAIKALPADYPDAKFIGMDCIEPHTLKPFFLYDFKEFKSAGNYFRKNQVLYGRMRPYLNKVYKAEFDGTCSGEFIILDCDEDFNPDLLKYIFHAKDFVSFANRITTGDRPRISYEEIADYDILLPSIEEQNKIVQEIESRLSVADKMEESINQSLQQSEALRQSILKKAFEGKLI